MYPNIQLILMNELSLERLQAQTIQGGFTHDIIIFIGRETKLHNRPVTIRSNPLPLVSSVC